jgi:hypothetical protein
MKAILKKHITMKAILIELFGIAIESHTLFARVAALV